MRGVLLGNDRQSATRYTAGVTILCSVHCKMSSLPVVVEHVLRFANSAFVTSLIGAGAGALAGAYAAQRLVERAAERKELLAEIRNTNAGIMLAFAVWNPAYSLKKQHTKAMCDTYREQYNAAHEYEKKRLSAAVNLGTPPAFMADLRELPLLDPPIAALHSHVYDKVSVTGRPLLVVPTLVHSVSQLAATMTKRNSLIPVLQKLDGTAAFAARYFGLPVFGGPQDTVYPDTIEGTRVLLDSVMFFCKLLRDDLTEHGREVIAKLAATGCKPLPQLSAPDFEQAEREGLAPDETEFASWRKNFEKAPKPS